MVSNSSTGMKILLTSAANNSISASASVNIISNRYLPPECRDRNLCSTLNFESNRFSYYIIPSIRGFVMLSHRTNHTAIQTTFVNIAEECNPMKAFHDGTAEGHTAYVYNIVVACTDLQTRPHGIIYYLPYRFFPNSTGRGSIMRNYEQVTQSEPIYTPGTMSEVIFVRGQERCAEYDNLYFIDDAYIVHYPFNAFDPEFTISNNALKNCPGPYKAIEYYGNDTIVIRCSNNQAVFYDSCASRLTYPSTTNVPYPCTNWDNIIYRNGSKLTLLSNNHRQAMVTRKLPLRNLNYGKCIQVGNVSTFIGTSAEGEIFIAPFNVGTESKVINISSGDGFKASNGPVFSENEQAFVVFDSITRTLMVVNLTQTCNIINVSATFIPALISISQGQGVYNCSCQEMQPQLPSYSVTTAALGISTGEDKVTQQSIPLIPVVVATTIVLVVAIIFVMLVIT